MIAGKVKEGYDEAKENLKNSKMKVVDYFGPKVAKLKHVKNSTNSKIERKPEFAPIKLDYTSVTLTRSLYNIFSLARLTQRC